MLTSSPPAKLARQTRGTVAFRPLGAAKIDVTPTRPVLLSGYGSRKQELTLEVAQHLYARALAFGADEDGPAVLIAVDNLGISADMHRAVAAALTEKHGIPRARLTINASHSHSAPLLSGVATNIYPRDLTAEQQQAVEFYTAELTGKLIQVAEAALAARTPCRLDWGQTSADFAINRRGAKIVDHTVPILRAVDESGHVRAVMANYACHCVAAKPDLAMSGDWAGFAADEIETQLAGSVALVLVGCGADQNPADMGTLAAARDQGHKLAATVLDLPGETLTPVLGKVDTQFAEIDLSCVPRTKEEWDGLAAKGGAIAYVARKNLARLERGQPLSNSISYPIQTWTFGDDLGAIFLGGEVVVDYSALFAQQFDASRMWFCGYSNDSPCYIPSERILREGGYEGADAMAWYDKPGPFVPGLEKKILQEVTRQLAGRFDHPSPATRTGGTRPLSPAQSLARIEVPAGMRVELVAAEPLVVDPVAIDFGHDGRLWVVEMNDYPQGLGGRHEPGGRVRCLEDTDRDGQYDKVTTLLDGLPFPTGVKAWRKGALICAAPHVIYAEDTNGDGRADIRREALAGFNIENCQARVNSLALGLDNWIHGAAGYYGGMLTPAGGKPVDSNHRDFRFRPDAGLVEPVSGRTQQGRARDDWGNWFGCDSGTLLFHYPLTERYYSRELDVAPPHAALSIAPENQLYPRGQIISFALSGPPGLPTSACGLGFYRDTLLGEELSNNALICEPVNQLVHRMVLDPQGITFATHRAPSETHSEFLSSTDNWFRPVQVLTGPDGALYIVDMYRFLIEHPQWLTPEALAQIDVRAGDTLGRIYRVVPENAPLRPVPKLSELSTADVVAAMDSPNGPMRDMAQLELLWRADISAVAPLLAMARSANLPQVRLQALCAVEGLAGVSNELVLAALSDEHAAVRRHALRIAEALAKSDSAVAARMLTLIDDPDPQVRMQLAYSLGELDNATTGEALVHLLRSIGDEPYAKSAALSSLNSSNIGAALHKVFAADSPADHDLRAEILAATAKIGEPGSLALAAARLLVADNGQYATWQFAAVPSLLKALARHQTQLDAEQAKHWQQMLAAARKTIAADDASAATLVVCIGVLAESADPSDAQLIASQLAAQKPLVVQHAAIHALAKFESTAAIAVLFDAFNSLSPAVQSTVLDEALSRQPLTDELLARLTSEEIPRSAIEPARRQALANHPSADVRQGAERLFNAPSSTEIASLLDSFRQVDVAHGNPLAGRAVFQKHCAACHRMDKMGYTVGPDLAALSDKSPVLLLKSIVDPNAAVEGRYASYTAVTDGGQVFTGIMAGESARNIVLRGQEGKDQVVPRADLAQLSLGKSFMPEGLAREIPPRVMQDLLAFLVHSASKFDSVSRINDLLRGVQPGSKEELEKIHPIWEVAIEAGRRNDADEIRDLLDLSLPHADEPLALWQAVVIGGGIINGISASGDWPRERIEKLLPGDDRLTARWTRALSLAAALADDESANPGYRYDALRMVAMCPWEVAESRLLRYLPADAHSELRLGAVSGLADVPQPAASAKLVAVLGELNALQQKTALQGLVRGTDGAKQLLEAIAAGKLAKDIVSGDVREKLVNNKDDAIKSQAQKLLVN